MTPTPSDQIRLSLAERCAFVLFFVGSSTTIAHPSLVDSGLLPDVRFFSLSLCLPGAIIGAFYWCTRRSLANSFPIVAGLLFLLSGILLVDSTERGRAMLVTASILCALAAGAWVQEKRQWRLCATAFIAGTILSGAVAVNNYDGGIMGRIIASTGVLVGNRNGFAMQFVFATLLVIAVNSDITRRPMNYSSDLFLAIMAIAGGFAVLVFLTASRSGCLCLVVCTLVATAGRLSLGKIVAISSVAGVTILTLALLTMSGREPIVMQRFHDGTVGSAGGRIDIIMESQELFHSPRMLYFGVGTAGAHKYLGGLLDSASRNRKDGIYRKSSHNMYLEWFLSYGLVGAPVGIWLLGSLALCSRRRDKLESTTWRMAIVLFVCLSGMAGPFYISASAPGVLALVVSMPAHQT